MRVNRYSIAGLTGAVLILLVGLTALRSASEGWASTVALVVRSILLLAVVGAVYGNKTERVWWFGVALFGLGYSTLMYWSGHFEETLLTVKLVDILMTRLDSPLPRNGRGFGGDPTIKRAFLGVIHSLWSLAFAVIGGVLARRFFAAGVGQTTTLATEPHAPDKPLPGKYRWYRRIAFALAVLLLTAGVFAGVVAGVFVGASYDSDLFLGVTFLLTWGLVGVFALATIYSRGTQRARWLGATLFGAGYLVLIFGRGPRDYNDAWTHRVITDSIRTLWPGIRPKENFDLPSSRAIAVENERIWKILEQSVPMEFPRPTPLEEVITYIKAATWRDNEPAMPIYVDPIGLQEAEQTLKSTIVLQLEGVPLKRSLDILLKQIGMKCEPHEGILLITSETADSRPLIEDPRLPTAHFVLAILTAGVGSLIGLLVSRLCSESRAATTTYGREKPR